MKIEDIGMGKGIEEYKKKHPEEWQKFQDDIKDILDHWDDKPPRKTFKQRLKQLLCRHDYEDGSNLPGCQTFICSKCGKEIYYNPWKGFFK